MDNLGIKSLSVIFPCYNEEKNIVLQISSANSVLSKITEDYEIIIVDDGSTDQSKVLLEGMGCENDKIKVITHPFNLGYGRALQSGFRQASKDLVFFIAMDNQYNVSEIENFLSHIVDHDVVIGYRTKRNDPLSRILMSRLYNFLIRTLYGLKVRDIDCAFKLFWKNFISRLGIKSQYFFVDAEILLRATKLGCSIKELEVQHYPRTLGSSTINIKRVVLTLTEVVKFWKELHL